MKKFILLSTLLLVAFGFGSFNARYGQIGTWLYANATDLEASLAGFTQGSANAGEMQLAYYLHANPGKPTLVMLHGYSADKDVWVRFAKHFTADYQILIPDMAGHGDSPFDPSWSYSIPAQAQRLAVLMDSLGIPAAHVIGNSMGGFLTATFALRYPERTLSAVLVDAAGVVSPEPSELYTQLMAGNNPFLVHNRTEFDRFFAMTMQQRPFMPDLAVEAVSLQYIARREQLAKIFADFSESDYVEAELGKITVPTMIWWGDHDRLLHVSSVSVWQAGIPHAQTHIFKNIGHMPMVEVPAEAAGVYQQFLNSL